MCTVTAASNAAEVSQVPDCRGSTCSVPSFNVGTVPCLGVAWPCARGFGARHLDCTIRPARMHVELNARMDPSQRTISSLCKFATIQCKQLWSAHDRLRSSLPHGQPIPFHFSFLSFYFFFRFKRQQGMLLSAYSASIFFCSLCHVLQA